MSSSRLSKRQWQRIAAQCENPYCDDSCRRLWDEELEILNRLLKGDELLTARSVKGSTYAVSTYWSTKEGFADQWDGPVWMLLGRGMIRPVRCAGGATWLKLTSRVQAQCRAKGGAR